MMMAKLRKPNGKARYFELLIDTGADYTLISQYDAQLLTIEGRDFTIPVLIARDGVESLLGRKGIFEHFDVLFQESNGQVIFKKKAV